MGRIWREAILILCEPSEVDAHGVVTLTGARAAHVRGVLGATPGDVIRIGVVDGPRGQGEILALDEDRVVLRLASSTRRYRRRPPSICCWHCRARRCCGACGPSSPRSASGGSC